ncbi:hypothetical protein H8699_04855 [Christensenellaceae bacterium NSJ-44]|uniref:Uncharacterized protein n=1 Tax=Luoshenia tenuis TaxID=2763654 RepID=A0A926D0J5_9FIRM|nr:DUF5665 domain-containing protein [Luoshenia tenuis]MBC8528764.1 hypothetical protein [Luoshenia tenuis]SCJ76076.1 Uncharacterised protein [uncultured Clostridium sp.]
MLKEIKEEELARSKWLAAAERMTERLERTGITQYVELQFDLKRMLWRSFLSGIARGLGYVIGFTVLGAFLLVVLRKLAETPLGQSIVGWLANWLQ